MRRWPSACVSCGIGAFYSNPIVFEFFLGCLVFHIWKSGAAARLSTRACIVLLTAALLAPVVAEYYGIESALTGGRTVAFGAPAFVVVLMTVVLDGRRRFTNRIALELGNASYSIYLAHIFVIEALRKVIFPAVGWFDMSTIAGALMSVAVAAIAGVLVYRLIERPLVNSTRLRLFTRALPA